MTNTYSSPTLINCTFTGNKTIYAGGGVYNYKGSPTITNCTFTQNFAKYWGGGLHNDQIESIPQIVKCTFSQNQARQGGGIYNRNQTSPTIVDCLFLQNQSTIGCGGGIYNSNSSTPMVFNCRFIGNHANDDGGGFYCNNGTCAKLMNCLFSGNTSQDKAGGFYSRNNDLSALINCTFYGNSADYGGAMYVWGGSKPFLLNCIIWGNSAQQNGPQIGVEGSGSVVSIGYCDLQGDQAGIWTSDSGLVNWGAGNIATDPDFKDPDGADNVLGTIDDNLRVLNSSPCLDAGNNTSVPADTADLDQDGNTSEPTPLDLDGNKRFMESPVPDTGKGTPPIVDMGAYERGRSAAWEVLPPYNLLWPFWSPALSPENPINTVPTPLLTELTKDTVLPVQPAVVWVLDKPLVLFQKPSAGYPVASWNQLLYFDENLILNPWPPEYLVDPNTGAPLSITLQTGWEFSYPKHVDRVAKLIDLGRLSYIAHIDGYLLSNELDTPLKSSDELLPSWPYLGWETLPPYNMLWPLWSPVLSPPDPVTGRPTPLITELTKDTILPVQPVFIWDTRLDTPIYLYNAPIASGGGIMAMYWDMEARYDIRGSYGYYIDDIGSGNGYQCDGTLVENPYGNGCIAPWPLSHLLDPVTGEPVPADISNAVLQEIPTSELALSQFNSLVNSSNRAYIMHYAEYLSGFDIGSLSKTFFPAFVPEDIGGLSLLKAENQLWNQDTQHIIDLSEHLDCFGESQASGDFNGDGYDDLAIGIPREDIEDIKNAGAVNVIYGSAFGLSARNNQFWHQNYPGIQDQAEEMDEFGYSLAAGDFNNDGYDDLAIGIPYEEIENIMGAGAVNIIYGTKYGLSTMNSQIWHQDNPEIKDAAERGDFFGYSLAAGDFNNDRYQDLVIGVHGEEIDENTDGAGAVNIIYGSASGLSAENNQFWNQNSPDLISNKCDALDYFSHSLATGDFNGDEYDDLAIGVPREDIESAFGITPSAGAVNIIYGSQRGLSTWRNQFWHQDSPGIEDQVEYGPDFFGYSLAAGDFNSDGYEDLAIGVSLEDIGYTISAGAVNIIYGTASGLSAENNQFWYQDSPGIIDESEEHDEFGSSLTVGDFNNDGYKDLAIGVPRKNFGDADDVGSVHIIFGSVSGLSAADSQLWKRDSQGIPCTLCLSDTGQYGIAYYPNGLIFGYSLVAGNFDGKNGHDLAIGVPYDSLVIDNSYLYDKAGSVVVLYSPFYSPGEYTIEMEFQPGWNLMSLPVVPDSLVLSDVFPGSEVVYGYEKNVGYKHIQNHQKLEIGKGYWILFDNAQSCELTGQSIPEYSLSVNEEGWHMIGGCSSSAQASIDNGNIKVIYSYVQGTGYQRVPEIEELKPGQGYWILLSDIDNQTELRVQ